MGAPSLEEGLAKGIAPNTTAKQVTMVLYRIGGKGSPRTGLEEAYDSC